MGHYQPRNERNLSMARIYTVANNKGGCGKTATAVNLAAALRLRGFDALCIDLDAQANLTACLRVEVTAGRTMFDALKQRGAAYISPVRVLNPEGRTVGALDVLPATRDLSAVEVGLAQERDRLTRVRTYVDRYRDAYDVILIDTPPALGLLTISALYAADGVIMAVQPQYLAVQGLLSLRDTVANLNANGAAILTERVLFTQYDGRKGLHRLTVEQVAAAGVPMFNTIIRDNVALGEAPATGTDIFTYNRRSRGAADYAALADELIATDKLKHYKHQ